MHMMIYAIVYAKTEKDAFEHAKELFEEMCGDGKPFDYYATFDQDESITLGVAGKARWGEFPVIVKANTKQGKELIEKGLNYTKKYFMEDLAIIKKVVETKSFEEIWNIRHDSEMFRFRCSTVGAYRGWPVALYDNDGEGIQDPKHLQDVLDKWKCLPQSHEKYMDLEIWVVPADVHH